LKAQVLERQQGQQQMSQENPCVVDVNVQMLFAPVTLEQIGSDPFKLKELCSGAGTLARGSGGELQHALA
jgi:hypothetical protein